MTALDTPAPPPAADEPASPDQAKLFGIIAEFDNTAAVIQATQAAHAAGYRRMDVHSPFPIHGIDEVLGVKPTILPWIILVAGLAGMGSGLFLTTFTMADWLPQPQWVPPNFHGYEYLISGKPLNSLAAYIPVIFELTIMFAAYTAVFAMFLMNRLPLLSHPLFRSKNFRRTTQDRFFLAIESSDRQFDVQATTAFLQDQRAMSTELITDHD